MSEKIIEKAEWLDDAKMLLGKIEDGSITIDDVITNANALKHCLLCGIARLGSELREIAFKGN
jgi:hypothetical protein